MIDLPTLQEAKDFVADQLKLITRDILRYINPDPYKVSVFNTMFQFLHYLWHQAESSVVECWTLYRLRVMLRV